MPSSGGWIWAMIDQTPGPMGFRDFRKNSPPAAQIPRAPSRVRRAFCVTYPAPLLCQAVVGRTARRRRVTGFRNGLGAPCL